MQTVPTGWEIEFTQTLMNYCYAEVTLHLGDNDTMTFTKADMTSFEVSQSVSPINAELPQSSLRFSITTIDCDVRALQRSLTRMLKVTARVGVAINGEPSYINAGTFWLDTWDFPNGGIEASFEARDALYFLSSEKYIYGVYRRNGISLYDLADEVLTYAHGRFPCVTTWSINNVLSSSNTTAPLPVCTYAECLQYIAQASGTVLKYDRDGVIRFDLTSGDTSYNYIVTDTNCFAYPQLVMYPELRKLRCNVYTYSLDEIYSDTEHYPNVNGDATVSAVDAALVLAAAAHIGAGEPSGLTPEQEVKADADRDGMITAADAALIQEYAAKCGSGKYENTPDGWALFLNIKIGYKEKVYDSIHNIDEDMELVITYGTSAEVNVMKEGTITITNVDDYSNAAEITITGTDEDAQITAYGFPIEVSTHEYRRDVNESGDDEYIDNPLVTNNTTAGSATQDVKDFLSIRNGVECSDFRIDPRLDAGDTITVNIDGENTTYGNTIVTDVKYRFTGMFRGSISGRINIPEPEPDPNVFTLDASRFSSDNPVLYSTTGNQIATVSMQHGTVANSVYTVTDGLHVSGATRADFPVELPASGAWTIIYRFKNYSLVQESYGNVHMLFTSYGNVLETAYVSNWTTKAVHFRLPSTQATLYNATQLSPYGGFYDYATMPSDLQYYEMEYRWVNDGQTLSLWVNGVKKASISVENSIDILNLYIVVYDNHNVNEDDITVTHFEVKNTAELPDRVLYRWRLTGFRGSDNYTQVSRLCLYDSGGSRIDADQSTTAFALKDGSPADFPSANETCSKLTGDRSGKCVIVRGNSNQIDIILSTSMRQGLASYSYVTGNDEPNRDPVSWSLSKSLDGGQTWEEIDQQANVTITTERNTETQRFMIFQKFRGAISELKRADYQEETQNWTDAITGEIYHDDEAYTLRDGVALNCRLPEIANFRETGFTLYIKASLVYNSQWHQLMDADGARTGPISIFQGSGQYSFTNFAGSNDTYGEFCYNGGLDPVIAVRFDPSTQLYSMLGSNSTIVGQAELSYTAFPQNGSITWKMSRLAGNSDKCAATVHMVLCVACHSDEEVKANIALM